MKSTIKPLSYRPAWKALAAHQKKIMGLHSRQLFAADPKRGERMTVEAAGLFLDCFVTRETLKLLLKLAAESGLRGRISRDVPRREDQYHREPRLPRAAVAAAKSAAASWAEGRTNGKFTKG
jgi:hypothetical protein